MFQPHNLARTARATNAMAWSGLAVFLLGFAGERTMPPSRQAAVSWSDG